MKELYEILSGKSPDELELIGRVVKRFSDAQTSLEKIIRQKRTYAVATGNPHVLEDFARYIENYNIKAKFSKEVPQLRTGRHIGRLADSEYNTRREQIEKSIYDFCDKLPASQRKNITLDDFMKIKEVGDLARHNPFSLRNYLKTIRAKSSSRIHYNRPDQSYSISSALNYETVAEAADYILEKQNYCTWVDIYDDLGVENARAIGKYLSRLAKERNLKSRLVSMGREYHIIKAYYKGKTSPPISPKEKVRTAVKESDKDIINHSYIVKSTGLSDRAILTIMGSLGYKVTGNSWSGKMYHFKF